MAAKKAAFGFNTPFAEQLDFFRKKLNLPTARWDDITREQHDKAFIVAGAQKADLLKDLNAAVTKAIEQGTGLEAFRKDFAAIVQRHGWTGWTGEGSQAGVAWRTKVIYQTNLATSYAAGRYQQLTDPAFLKLRPYWRYVHNDSVLHPRPLHQHWGDIQLTLPHDHPFWATHFPPNGWGCMCHVTAVAGPQAGDATEPPDGWNQRNTLGRLPGIDSGFDYTPGKSVVDELRAVVDAKLATLPAPIGAAMWEAMPTVLTATMRQAVAEMVDTAATEKRASGASVLTHVVSPHTVSSLSDIGVPMASADIWLRDEELIHALRDTKSDRGSALPLSVWRDLPAMLESAKPYFDKEDPALVYAFDLPGGTGKVLVRVNYADKVRIDGKRSRIISNFVRTGGLIDSSDINNVSRYQPLKK